jgi:hypothetical protein
MLEQEVSLGQIARPFPEPPFQNLTVSPLGLILKKDSNTLEPPFQNFTISLLGLVPKKDPNTFHLIHDLSFQQGHSVNDFIFFAAFIKQKTSIILHSKYNSNAM